MNNHNIHWDDLRIFAAVVSAGSFSRAAQILGVSQPTVSRRIEALERELEGPLLERTAQGCFPTKLGETLVPLTERMTTAARGITRLALNARHDLSGIVRIASGELVGRYLARHSWRITSGASGLQLEILVGMKMVNLFAGEAEIALRNLRPDNDQLFARKLWSTQHAVYGSPSFAEANPGACDERRWHQCRWAGFTRTQDQLPSARWLAERLPENQPNLRFSTSSLILEAVASGSALALLPTFVGDDDSRLVRLSDPLAGLVLDLWMVTHPNVRNLPRVRWVMERLAEIFAAT